MPPVERTPPSRFRVSIHAGGFLGFLSGLLNACVVWFSGGGWSDTHVFLTSLFPYVVLGVLMGAGLGLFRAHSGKPRRDPRGELLQDVLALVYVFLAVITAGFGAGYARTTRHSGAVIIGVLVGIAVLYLVFRLSCRLLGRMVESRLVTWFLDRPPWRRLGVIGGLLFVLFSLVPPMLVPSSPADELPSGKAPPGARNVVLILIDTARADHFSTYGYERQTTPEVDRIASDAILFERAISTANWTVPAHASILTGTPASVHGADGQHMTLGPTLTTLPEILGRHGYLTIGMTNNPLFSHLTGMTRGFGRFEDHWRSEGIKPVLLLQRIVEGILAKWRAGKNYGGADYTLPRLLKWIDRTRSEPGPDGRPRPFFAFVNLLEPHTRLAYHKGFTDLFMTDQDTVGDLIRTPQTGFQLARIPESRKEVDFRRYEILYDGEIRFADHYIGKFVEGLDRRGLLDQTLLIITSDHGTGMGEHGMFSHGHGVYQEVAWIPLILRPPESEQHGVRVHEPVVLSDLFETILTFSGVQEPLTGAASRSRNLLDLSSHPPGWEVVVEETTNDMFNGIARKLKPDLDLSSLPNQRRKAIYKGDLKYILNVDGQSEELYKLASDPGERDNLAEKRPSDRKRLSQELNAWVEGLPSEDTDVASKAGSEPDAETKKALRSLGYIQ